MDTPVFKEPLLGYYPCCIGFLTGRRRAVDGTVSVGQFDWGGRLPKSNGGAQRYPQLGWKPSAECKGKRVFDCETHKSSRDPCSTCGSRSQTPFCLCTLRLVSIQAEGIFGRLRYSLGGDRPSQTARLTLSRQRLYVVRLEIQYNRGSIPTAAP